MWKLQSKAAIGTVHEANLSSPAPTADISTSGIVALSILCTMSPAMKAVS